MNCAQDITFFSILQLFVNKCYFSYPKFNQLNIKYFLYLHLEFQFLQLTSLQQLKK